MLLCPGGGIHADNVKRFKQDGFGAVHLSGAKYNERLDVRPTVSMNSPSFLSDQGVFVSNVDAIKNVLKEVK